MEEQKKEKKKKKPTFSLALYLKRARDLLRTPLQATVDSRSTYSLTHHPLTYKLKWCTVEDNHNNKSINGPERSKLAKFS